MLVAGRLIRSALLLLAIAGSACTGPAAPPGPSVGVARPGGSYDLSPAALAIGCAAGQVAWSITEDAVTPGQAGSITSSGLFTAPACGSPWVGASVHVVAAGCGRSVTVEVAVAEAVQGVTITDAVLYPGTPQACHAAPPISVLPGTAVQFYARVDLTCRQVYAPPPPATWVPDCP